MTDGTSAGFKPSGLTVCLLDGLVCTVNIPHVTQENRDIQQDVPLVKLCAQLSEL